MVALLHAIPVALTSYRLTLGFVAIGCAWHGADPSIYAVILVTGILSDIFDGIIARKLGIATVFLRRYDSAVDVIYYICILITGTMAHPTAIREHLPAIIVILVSEGVCFLVCLVRFQCLPGTQSFLARCYGIVIFTCFFVLLVCGRSRIVFAVTATVAVIANREIVLIMLASTVAPVDVKSILHLRRQAPG
jgi:CDP-diacylglycerol--glycerol-3-phosphate 3-phosphatidyltransferase